MLEHQIDCIVRFHDFSRLAELNRCVFSLLGQTYRPLNIILAVQRFTLEQLAAVKASLAPMLNLPNAPSLQIENLTDSSVRDARTELLNLGLAAATGQYVAFLDYDDVLYPEAYSILALRMQASQAAISFASVRLLKVDIFPQFIRSVKRAVAPFHGHDLRDLFRANFCPIHSYLIDRSKIGPTTLRFDTSLSWEEDYDLLLKICAAYPSDFSALDKIIGDYYFKSDGSNTVATGNSLDQARNDEYKRVSALIEARRRVTYVAPAVQKQLGFASILPTMTVRDALSLIRK
ncbi:glycosyltransferase [Undibacterium sp. Ren11W]|uniref:glycosyltransferase n=1 Tax=Undibacterium sp. Ren11W TaxID=3413045 RepID=UPI003BF44FFE